MATRIMYIEAKDAHVPAGEPVARIGRVTFSRSMSSVHYRGRTFLKSRARLIDASHIDLETGETFWISGCKRNGEDARRALTIHVDEDVREEYWSVIRGQ